ncbi:MAG: 23S rRNA (pseudouridine(1915)-N(3))-methyltransferase RlmH [Candidatus Woesearchaeota archaeon]
MTKITLVAIGKVKERYIQEGIQEFEKRLTKFCKLEIVELKEDTKENEAKKLEKYLKANTYVLDEKGAQYTSEGFAQLLKPTEDITFIIGNFHGLDESIKKRGKLLALSKLTFTHEMCRLFLIEQIYRGYNILNGTQYHK